MESENEEIKNKKKHYTKKKEGEYYGGEKE